MNEAERKRLLNRAADRMERRKQKALRDYREQLKKIDADYMSDKVKIYEPKPKPKPKVKPK